MNKQPTILGFNFEDFMTAQEDMYEETSVANEINNLTYQYYTELQNYEYEKAAKTETYLKNLFNKTFGIRFLRGGVYTPLNATRTFVGKDVYGEVWDIQAPGKEKFTAWFGEEALRPDNY